MPTSNVVNLAAVVSDGERIYVPKVGETIPVVVGGTPHRRRYDTRRSGQCQLGDG